MDFLKKLKCLFLVNLHHFVENYEVRKDEESTLLTNQCLTLILAGKGGNFTPCWFSLKISETVEAVTLAICNFSNISLETFVPNLVSLTHSSL